MWPCLSCMDVGHAWKMLPEVRNVVCKEKREKSPMWDEKACTSIAAYYEDLECLKYLHKTGHPWDESTCAAAAGNYRVDCLEYAHKNGCAWDKQTIKIAAARGALECLEYAHENACPA